MTNFIKGLFQIIVDLLLELGRAIFIMGTGKGIKENAEFLKRNELLSRFEKGFSLTGKQNLDLQTSRRSALVIAKSGGGKTAVCCIPSLLNLIKHKHSIICFDANLELMPKTCGYAQSQGYVVKVLSPQRIDISDSWNPLSRVNDISGCQKVAALIIRNELGDNQRDPFWGQMGTLLLTVFIRLVKLLDPKYGNLSNVKFLLDSMIYPVKLDKLIVRTKDRSLINEWAQFAVLDSKLRSSIVSTCRGALNLYTDPTIQKLTASDTLSIESLRSKPTILYIQPPSLDRYYSNFWGLFFEQLFAEIMSRIPESTERHIFFVIDEAGSGVYIPTLGHAISQLRKFLSGIMLIIQDYSQLVHNYGVNQAESIRSNSNSIVYFPGMPMSLSTELERLSGTVTVDTGKVQKTKPLISASQVRSMPEDNVLIVSGALPPILTKVFPYYRNLELNRLTKLPITDLPTKTLSEVPFIELPA